MEAVAFMLTSSSFVSPTIVSSINIKVLVTVKNAGKVAGKEVVQVYVAAPIAAGDQVLLSANEHTFSLTKETTTVHS